MIKALEIAKIVLKENEEPMNTKEIYEYAEKHYKEKVEETFSGATPIDSLGSCLYVDSKKQNSIFTKYKEGNQAVKFGLKEKIYNNEEITKSEIEKTFKQSNYKEIDLHKYLVSYMSFKYNIYSKTINANKSTNRLKDKNTWLHPDIIGVKFLKENYNKNTISLMKLNNENLFELYSFEMKKEINISNANIEFMQASINSSWANYGYLVAKEIDTSEEVIEKLERLNSIFGIGVIKLNTKAYSESKKIMEAKKKNIDYDYINNLIDLGNDDINIFFNEVIAISNDLRNEVVSNIFDKPFESDTEGEIEAENKGMKE